MAYIGKKVEETELANRTVDTMTGDGSDTTMSLSATPISVNNVLVFFNGVMQRPTTDFTLSGSTITFGTAPFTGAVVVAITGEGGHIGRPSSPLTTEKFMDSAVTNAKIGGLASSKLTGAMPALDGSALSGGATGYTENASDPAVTTNPSGGVGTFWVNTTSGETFCCTDATSNANIWTNVGGGFGDIRWNGWGTQYGYVTGGHGPSPVNQTTIGKHSFTSDSNAVDVGDLITGNHANTGSQDLTHGYVAGGSTSPYVNTIQRLAFSGAGGNTSSVGTLTVARAIGGGASSRTHGYVAGGDTSPANTGINVIEKFAFSASTTGSDIGDLTANKTSVSGVGSQTHGYIRGGRITSTYNNVIERWPFASDTNSSDVGDIITAGGNLGFNGQNSKTHGYGTGGDGTGNNTRIQKHAFAASADATGVGTLAVVTTPGAGTSSHTNGYVSGSGDSAPATNNIQKFSFSSDGNASDIADLTVGRGNAGSLSN